MQKYVQGKHQQQPGICSEEIIFTKRTFQENFVRERIIVGGTHSLECHLFILLVNFYLESILGIFDKNLHFKTFCI